MSTTTITPAQVESAVANLVRWLETGEAPDRMLAADCFLDLTLPQWRLQTGSAQEVLAVRRDSHPFAGSVRVERVDRTDRGFVLAFEERWGHEGQRWYCREQIRADVVGDTIVDMAVYCTGDWDEARQGRPRRGRDAAAPVTVLRSVTLLRP